jgi:hypothetical protein
MAQIGAKALGLMVAGALVLIFVFRPAELVPGLLMGSDEIALQSFSPTRRRMRDQYLSRGVSTNCVLSPAWIPAPPEHSRPCCRLWAAAKSLKISAIFHWRSVPKGDGSNIDILDGHSLRI